MSKLVQEVRHFELRLGADADATHEEIAAEAVRLAKGGHVVRMALPSGTITVSPDHTHEDVVPMVADAMPSKGKTAKAKAPPPAAA